MVEGNRTVESAAFWAGQAVLIAVHIRDCLDNAAIRSAETWSAEYAIAVGYVPVNARHGLREQVNLVIGG